MSYDAKKTPLNCWTCLNDIDNDQKDIKRQTTEIDCFMV